MKTYVRIEDGIALEIITRPNDFDITKVYHPDLVWVLTTQSVSQGDLFNGFLFTSPPSRPTPPLISMSAEDLWEVLRNKNLVRDVDVPNDRRQPPRRL